MWALRVMHESKLWSSNCFVTLTYDDEHLPPLASLRYRDVQLFHKRLRRVSPFRFFVVGEYGEELGRPHYHGCYFGYFPSDAKRLRALSAEKHCVYESQELSKAWGLGHVHLGSLTYQSARYCAGYIFKKQYGDRAEDRYKRVDADGVWHPIEPEFARMSLRPGIGRGWYERFADDFHTEDVAVLDGKRFPVPKYYDRLLERVDPGRLSDLREGRERKAVLHRSDNTVERLAVRAEVALAGIHHIDKRFSK